MELRGCRQLSKGTQCLPCENMGIYKAQRGISLRIIRNLMGVGLELDRIIS